MRGKHRSKKHHKDHRATDDEPPRASVDGDLDLESPPGTPQSAVSNGTGYGDPLANGDAGCLEATNGNATCIASSKQQTVLESGDHRLMNLMEVNDKIVKKLLALRSENEELLSRIAEREDELRIAKKNLDEENYRRRNADDSVSEISRELESLKDLADELNSMKPIHHHMKDEIACLEYDKKALKMKLDSAVQERDAYKEKVIALGSEQEVLQVKLQASLKETDALKCAFSAVNNEIESLVASEKQKAALQKEVIDLDNQIGGFLVEKLSLLNEKNELETMLSKVRRELEDVLGKLEESKQIAATHEAEAQSLTCEIERLSSFSEGLSENNARLQSSYNEKATDFKAQKEAMEGELNRLSDTLKASVEDSIYARDTIEALKVDMEKAKLENVRLDAALIDAQSHLQLLEKENMDFKVRESESEALVYNLQTEKHMLETQYRQASNDLAKVQEKMLNLESSTNAERHLLGSELEGALAQIEALQESIKKLTDEATEVKEEKVQVQKLLVVAEQGLSELDSKSSLLEASNAGMREELQKMEGIVARGTEELDVCKKELAPVKEALEALHAMKKVMSDELSDKEKAMSAMEMELRRHGKQRPFLGKEIAAAIVGIIASLAFFYMGRVACSSPS